MKLRFIWTSDLLGSFLLCFLMGLLAVGLEMLGLIYFAATLGLAVEGSAEGLEALSGVASSLLEWLHMQKTLQHHALLAAIFIFGGVLLGFSSQVAVDQLGIKWATFLANEFGGVLRASRKISQNSFNTTENGQKLFTDTTAITCGLIPAVYEFGIASVFAVILILGLVEIASTAIVFAIGFAVVVGLFLWFVKPLTKKFSELLRASNVSSVKKAKNIFEGRFEYRLYDVEAFFHSDFIGELRSWGSARLFLNAVQRSIPLIIVLVGQLTILLALGLLDSAVGADGLAFFVVALTRLTPVVGKIARSLNKVVSTSPYVKGYLALVSRFQDFSPGVGMNSRSASNRGLDTSIGKQVWHEVKIEDVRISHGTRDSAKESGGILGPYNIVIRRGEHQFWTGPSGCGKSSLVDVVGGFKIPLTGRILVDDVSLDFRTARDFPIAIVRQTPFIIDDSIIANIRFGRDASVESEKLLAIMKTCEVTSFCGSILDAESFFVGENACELSGGQKQKLAIARALFTTPQLLVLDEATSAMDTSSESRVLEGVLDLCQSNGSTVVVISHNKNLQKLFSTVKIFRG